MTQPAELEGTDVSKEGETINKIKAALSDLGQFYASFKHSCTEYKMKNDSREVVNLVTIDSWFANINEKLKFKCFKELATVRFNPALNLKTSE